MAKTKVRASNLELLRLIAMFGVLVVHTDFGILGFPTYDELLSSPMDCSIRVIIEFLAIVAVNVFVLISGWFGITFRWKGLCNLLFQCAFFFFGIYGFCIICGYKELSLNGIYMCLMLSDNGWFIKCYIGMYIFAPVMNAFVKQASKKEIGIFLVCFFSFQSLYGWFATGAAFIEEGYSAFSFMGLYLLARYVGIYRPKYTNWNVGKNLIVYSSASVLSAMVFLTALYLDLPSYQLMMFRYTNPLTIIAALYLLLVFKDIAFTSKTINAIAASCFAVYLMHFMLFQLFMRPWIKSISENTDGLTVITEIFLLLIGFFMVSIVIDRVRLAIWKRKLLPLFENDHNK